MTNIGSAESRLKGVETTSSKASERPNRLVWHWPAAILMTLVIVAFAISCIAVIIGDLWLRAPDLQWSIMGFLIASFSMSAIFLAWAPCRIWLRIALVVGLMLLTLTGFYIGKCFNEIFNFQQWGFAQDVTWETALVVFSFLPLIIACLSVVAWRLRAMRDWKVVYAGDKLRQQNEENISKRDLGRWESACCLAMIVLASLFLLFMQNFNDTTNEEAVISLGLAIPFAIAIGALVIFPAAWLLLGARRYWLWSLSIVTLVCLTRIVFEYLLMFQGNAPRGGISFWDVLNSGEFYNLMTMLCSAVLAFTVICLLLRLFQFRLVMPCYERPKFEPESKSDAHPLDD